MVEKEPILVSACFLKYGFKYNGDNNYNEKILALQKKYNFILVCPEVLGGLATPREPSEIKNNKIINKKGIDVSEYFYLGALKTLQIAKVNNCKKAILKANSPSCGYKEIYDGSFSHKKIKGNGITAQVLYESGIQIFTEDEIDNL